MPWVADNTRFREVTPPLDRTVGRWSRPVSRVLSPQLSPRVAAISLGRRLPGASSDRTRSTLPCGNPGGQPSSPRRRKAEPIWSCSEWGFPGPPITRGTGELLPRRFTLTLGNFPASSRRGPGRFVFCGTFLPVARTPRYGAPCPTELGLSSRCGSHRSRRPPGRLQRPGRLYPLHPENATATVTAPGHVQGGVAAGRCRTVASFALDRILSTLTLEAHNSPCGLKQCASPLRGRSRAAAPVPSRFAMRPPVTVSPPPRQSPLRTTARRMGCH